MKDTSLEALTITRTLEIYWEMVLIFIYTRFNETDTEEEVEIKEKARHLAKFFHPILWKMDIEVKASF